MAKRSLEDQREAWAAKVAAKRAELAKLATDRGALVARLVDADGDRSALVSEWQRLETECTICAAELPEIERRQRAAQVAILQVDLAGKQAIFADLDGKARELRHQRDAAEKRLQHLQNGKPGEKLNADERAQRDLEIADATGQFAQLKVLAGLANRRVKEAGGVMQAAQAALEGAG